MRKCLIATTIITGLVWSGAVQAEAVGPSFNCRYAYAPDEVIICQDKDLAAKDREMAQTYAWALRNNPDPYQTNLIRRTQVVWLNRRHACGYDADCISRLYDKRLFWLGDQAGEDAQ
jgi:uncharacterized protein